MTPINSPEIVKSIFDYFKECNAIITRPKILLLKELLVFNYLHKSRHIFLLFFARDKVEIIDKNKRHLYPTQPFTSQLISGTICVFYWKWP